MNILELRQKELKTLKRHISNIWSTNCKINAINVTVEVRNNLVEMRFCLNL